MWARSRYTGGGEGNRKNSWFPRAHLTWAPYLYDVFISWFALSGLWHINHRPILLHCNNLDWNWHRFARQDGRVKDFCVLYAHTHNYGTDIREAKGTEHCRDQTTEPKPSFGQKGEWQFLAHSLWAPCNQRCHNFPGQDLCLDHQVLVWQTYRFTLSEPIYRFGCYGNEIHNATMREGTSVGWQNLSMFQAPSPGVSVAQPTLMSQIMPWV